MKGLIDMATEIFKDYEEFCRREDKLINGVTELFARRCPHFERDNNTNQGCFNCEGCINCIDCNACKFCVRCIDCVICYYALECKDSTFIVINPDAYKIGYKGAKKAIKGIDN